MRPGNRASGGEPGRSLAVAYLESSYGSPRDIDSQLRILRQAARTLHTSIAAEFIDTGYGNDRRTELDALIAYVAGHDVDYCLVQKRERFHRDRDRRRRILEWLHQRTCVVAVADDGIWEYTRPYPRLTRSL